MLLFLLVVIPFLGSLLSWIIGYYQVAFSRWIALITTIIDLLISLLLWFKYYFHSYIKHPRWDIEFFYNWMPNFGINFHLAMDGLSLLFIILTSFLGVISVICSWNEIKRCPQGFYFHLLCVISGTMGVFLSIDLFLFFCFWELIIIPMYFLIALWGRSSDNITAISVNAANKFFIFAQLSGLLMLFSIIGLVIHGYLINNIINFDYNALLHISLSGISEWLIMIGFFVSFMIKLPIVPFHQWLPDAHSQAPTAGSIDLSGLVIKMPIYGLLRFCFPLFPRSSIIISSFVVVWGIFSAFYGSWLAFTQTNIKRMLAYSSISNMGFIIAALYSGSSLLSYHGVVIQTFVHSISSASLFVLSGELYKRLYTMDIMKMGGLWSKLTWLPGFFLFFSLATIGIPGTGNFIGEFMVLLGAFKFFPILTGMLTCVLLFSAIYFLNVVNIIFYGNNKVVLTDNILCIRELFILSVCAFLIILFGLYPNVILNTSYYSIQYIYSCMSSCIN
ncbi:MAG: complex I subunit 4 family protein [Buchnera aphidicola (Eriosoma harunire)]